MRVGRRRKVEDKDNLLARETRGLEGLTVDYVVTPAGSRSDGKGMTPVGTGNLARM